LQSSVETGGHRDGSRGEEMSWSPRLQTTLGGLENQQFRSRV